MIDKTLQVDTDLPFTVEPPSTKLMRLWAKFGEQAANVNDVDVLSDVYRAFLWQYRAVEAFAHVQSLFTGDPQYVPFAVNWLDMLVYDIRWSLDKWVEVLTAFQQHDLPGKRWERDAIAHVEELQALLTQVCACAVTFSTQSGFPLSEELYHICASVLPGVMPQQTSSPLQQ